MKLFWLVTGGTAEVIRAASVQDAIDLARPKATLEQRIQAERDILELTTDGPCEIISSY